MTLVLKVVNHNAVFDRVINKYFGGYLNEYILEILERLNSHA